jgi:hypothetical protein
VDKTRKTIQCPFKSNKECCPWIRIYSRFLSKKHIVMNVTIFLKLFVGYWHVFMSWIWSTPKRGNNKWSWQINDVLYFSFDIQANYNILNKIIIYFSTDNFLAFPRRIVWEGSQKAYKFTGGGIHVQELGLCSSIQIKISMHIG